MMDAMQRNPAAAAAEKVDLTIVGGGIYGVCLALEATQRGQRVLLLERGDLGGEVSWNSLRILHGGLRYLQKMDLKRFFESVGERRWFLANFPDVTRPLPCMMPLYGDGLRRPAVFQVAVRMNDAMSCRRNAGVVDSHRLGRAKVVSAERTAELFPAVDRDGLKGAALWQDGQMTNSQRVMMELCRWAASSGATLLNYVEATGLETRDGKVLAVEAKDVNNGDALRFETDRVVNAAGPWCAEVSDRFGDRRPELFRPAIAFNVLFDRPPVAETAVAVAAKEPGARTYFLHNEGPHLLGGTYHAALPPESKRDGRAFEDHLRYLVGDYIDQVNRGAPELQLKREEVLRAYVGQLPAHRDGDEEPTDHPIIHNHATTSGPSGLWSVSGVKYTTARLVAEQTLRKMLPDATRRLTARPVALDPLTITASDTIEDADWADVVRVARSLKESEAVVRFEDLMLRRTAWARDPDVGRRVAERLGPELGYDANEIAACCAAIGRRLFDVSDESSAEVQAVA